MTVLRCVARALCVLLVTLFSVAVAEADPISLLFTGEAKADSFVRLEWDEGDFLYLDTKKGETAKDFTERYAKILNGIMPKHTVEAKATTIGHELRIFPKPGIANFTKAKDAKLPTDTDHGFNYSPSLIRKKASLSTFELEELATTFAGDVTWNLYVVFDEKLVGTSTHTVSNLVLATDLLELFASDLAFRGFNVKLAGRELTMFSPTGQHFFVERSDSTNLYPRLSMAAVPEPAVVAMFVLGLLGVAGRRVSWPFGEPVSSVARLEETGRRRTGSSQIGSPRRSRQ